MIHSLRRFLIPCVALLVLINSEEYLQGGLKSRVSSKETYKAGTGRVKKISSSAELKSAIANNDIVVVKFFMERCGHCVAFAPIYEKLAAAYPQVEFLESEVTRDRESASLFGVRGVPHIRVFKKTDSERRENGEIRGTQVEAKAQAIEKAIKA